MPAAIAFIATSASLAGGTSVLASTAIYYGVSTAIYAGLSIGAQYLSQALAGTPQGPRPSDVKTNIRESVAWRLHSVGLVRVGGPVLFYERKNDNMHKIFATGSGQIDSIVAHFIDDKEVSVAADGKATDYDADLYWRLGAENQPAYEELLGAFPDIWTAAHQGNGFPHALMVMDQGKLQEFSNNWPKGINTEYSQVQRSARLFDPRTGVTAFSENAALAIRYFLTSPYGMALDPSWVENADDTYIAAANVADQDVAIKGGGTEKRWRLANTWSLNERRVDVLNRLLAACDGEIYATPNKGLGLRVGQWEEPTVTLDESAIVSVSGLTRGGDPLARANAIRATFTSRDHKFEEVEADPWVDDDDIAARGEEPDSIQVYAAPSHSQARRLMKIRHRRLNPRWRGTFVCNLKGLRVLGKRFVRIQMSIPPIDETFEITSPIGYLLSETNTIKGVTFEAASMSAEAWAWYAQTEEGTPPRVPDDPDNVDEDVAAVAGFTLTKVTRSIQGNKLPFARFKATPPVNANDQIEFEIARIQNETGEIVSHAYDTYQADYGPLEDDTVYYGRARIKTIGGTPGAWTDYIAVSGTEIPAALAPKAFTATLNGAAVNYSARADETDDYVARLQFRRGTANQSFAQAVIISTQNAKGGDVRSGSETHPGASTTGTQIYRYWAAAINVSGAVTPSTTYYDIGA